MRILVCPHSFELGGSQLNAVELAAAVRDRGHQVYLYGPVVKNDLLPLIRELEIPVIPRIERKLTPSPRRIADIARAVRTHNLDIIHGYEWPPALEAYAAASMTSAVSVATIMSMAVANFIPDSMSLAVGTAALQRRTRDLRSGPVHLLEPPVDTRRNAPGITNDAFRVRFPSPSGTLQVVIVSRLVPELKLEGILTAIAAVGVLRREVKVRLVIVGDGPARQQVTAASDRVNSVAGAGTILLTGAMSDPRAAYDSADICIGMGGSALRAMAFAKPVIIQGEGGFFRLVEPESLNSFLESGWYGMGQDEGDAAVHRCLSQLELALLDGGRRRELGDFGRTVVEQRYSLEAAGRRQEEIYTTALRQEQSVGRHVADAVRAMFGLARYKSGRLKDRVLGRATRDDFNSRASMSAG